MKKLISIFLVAILTLGLFGCGEVETPDSQSTQSSIQGMQSSVPDTQENEDIYVAITSTDLMSGFESSQVEVKESDSKFIENQMNLALKLFKSSANEDKDENVLISPLSIQLALAMTANGADGQTKAEMEALLGGEINLDELNNYLYTYVNNLPSDEKYKLEIANSIWYRDTERLTVKDEFLQTNKDYYDAEVYKAPFDNTTVEDINNWVSDNTDGMIDKIIQEIDDDTIMYLINAIIFDAEWHKMYDEYSVRDGKFTSISGEEQDVEMMRDTLSYYIETENALGFKKSYKNGKYSFVALLPNENITLEEYISSLNANELLESIDNMKNGTVYTAIPKFSCDYELKMKDVLKELGMPTAFDGDYADFSPMGEYQNGNIHISQVIHKTSITVGEKGTRAGAVTAEIMEAGSAPVEPIEITLDCPFLYMIIDNETNLPIFIGTLTHAS